MSEKSKITNIQLVLKPNIKDVEGENLSENCNKYFIVIPCDRKSELR